MQQPAGAIEAPLDRSGDRAIRVRGLAKSFAIPRHRAWTLKERVRHPLVSLGHDRLQALEDVSFDVAPGEFFAVIGRNGSGKSTLLRCLAGIHDPDSGEVAVHGRIAPFIELGVGFHPQLAAPDNVTLAATLMGLRPAEARRRFPSVIAFAELEEFVDMQIGNYSSGMQVRLAFSTSFQVDAEVLLFDEVLAVGDELFRRKCYDTFERLVAKGHTIVYVSHSLDTVARFADRVLLLDGGRMVALDKPEAVIEQYQQRNRERERRVPSVAPADPRLVTAPGGVAEVAPAGGTTGMHHGRWAGLRRFVDVSFTLARAEFKLRYLDSVIGYLWALAQPLLLFAVLYLVWAKLFHAGTNVPHYAVGLLLGLALFTFFSEATGHALVSLVAKGTMLRKIRFSPLALPLSSVITSSFVYGLTLVIVLGFVLVSGITPGLGWVELIPVLALLVAFTMGMALLLSLLYVAIRDVEQIWVVATRLLFFVTPVFYPIEIAPHSLQHVLMLNPLAVVAVQARHVLLDPSGPSALVAAGGAAMLAVPIGLTAAVLLAGVLLYRRQGRQLAERIY
jgi:ABC-type polysaccharide/polyol phosphate transport system ATPase subunit/ABC-type polysaccharide/polyol phosphate export permease